jgi:hypothetical protein
MPEAEFHHHDDDLDALIWGAANIARVANTDVRRAFHLLERGVIPASKVGKFWVTTKRKIRAMADAPRVARVERPPLPKKRRLPRRRARG